MANNLKHFAVHDDDVDRARGFYEKTFGWQITAWGPPGFFLIKTLIVFVYGSPRTIAAQVSVNLRL
jgi:predicted enzyme related to lactoylglutathione lyase